jgi:hypothetical protein
VSFSRPAIAYVVGDTYFNILAAEIGHYFTNSAGAGACIPSLNRGIKPIRVA